MKSLKLLIPLFFILLAIHSCTEQKEHIAPAVHEKDSVALMTTYGINMLISDSGVIKYRIVAEETSVNPNVNPKRTIFIKGIFLTQFDENFHVNSYIQCDTAYKYDELRLYELRGRVRILTKDGVRYEGEELFWDQNKHEYYSNKPSYFETPERTLTGNYFRSDEDMKHYYVSNTSGSFERNDIIHDEDHGSEASDGSVEKADSVPVYVRPKERPRAKS